MKYFIAIILILKAIAVMSQPIMYPRIDEPLPEFTLLNVQHYKEKMVTNNSFKGKWLILHFWSLGCSSAVRSLDVANEIQSTFKDDLKILLVGYKRGLINEGIEKVFDRKRKTHNYDLAVAYDTLLYSRWNVAGVPTIYIVDPQGVLRYITTSGDHLNVEKFRDLIAGKIVHFRSLNFEYKNTSGRGMFQAQLSPETLIYSSVLTQWKGEYPQLGYELDRFVHLPEERKEEGWSVAFATLTRLYQYAYHGRGWFQMADTAYYGKVHIDPIIEVRDKSPFTVHEFETGKGYYNYFLKLPSGKCTMESMMEEMQKMLHDNFGYDAQIETREMPVWRLKANPRGVKKLRSKGGEPKFYGVNSVAGVKVQNYLMKDFLRLVTANLPNDSHIPFLDDTGIDFRVDADIQTDMTDFESVQKALVQYGLELVKGSQEMRVLVIRDR